jgi:tripartite-type tricarboxylate transporter receptor subunit TctC
MKSMNFAWTVCAGLALGMVAGTAAAQDNYPTRPIRLVVGFAPGGGADGVARLMAEHMSRTLGQQVVIENRPGAATTLAPGAVASAAPDGYTLLLAPDSVFGADKLLYRPNVKYDETNFTPISRWATTFFVLATSKKLGASSVADLVAKAKANNNELFVASTQGLYPAMIIHQFNRLTGVKLNQVPYKGGAPAVMAVVAGEAPVTFAVPTSVMPMAADGRLDALAITAAKRSPLTPNLPTLDEAGLKGFNVSYWFGLAAPAGLPRPIAQKLFDASAAALADAGVRGKLQNLGYEPTPSASLAEFQQQAVADGAVLRQAVESLGLAPPQ